MSCILKDVPLIQIRDFIQLTIETPNFIQFQSIIALTLCSFELAELELADICNTSAGAIHSWNDSKSAPEDSVAKYFLQPILDLYDREIALRLRENEKELSRKQDVYDLITKVKSAEQIHNENTFLRVDSSAKIDYSKVSW